MPLQPDGRAVIGQEPVSSEDWTQQRAALVQRARALAAEFDAIAQEAHVLAGDSDVQPDPYIDAMAAEHVQEFGPEVVFLRHEGCASSQCATCSTCGLHIADDDEAWRCLKCGPLALPITEDR